MTKKEMEVGTLYELNRSIAAQLPPQPQEHLQEQLLKIKNWFYDNVEQYAMLLCREKADYTLFNIATQPTFKIVDGPEIELYADFDETVYDKLIKNLELCIKNRGILMAINKATEDAWEIWIKDIKNKEIHMYMLFECGPMVIEV